MTVATLRGVGVFAMLAFVQACSVDESLGYWRPAANPSAAREEDSAVGNDALRKSDAAVASGLGDTPAARAGTGAAGGGGNVVSPSSSPTLMPSACQMARAGTPALEVTVTDVDTKLYDFASGAQFPPGNYRVAYVDGCRKYDATGAWTLHASVLAATLAPTRRGGAYMIMSGAENLGLTPGTVGVIVGPGDEPNGGFATYAECVAANRALAPVDFAFSGGTVGVMNAGDANTISNTRGEDVGGRSPTFRLSRLDPCP